MFQSSGSINDNTVSVWSVNLAAGTYTVATGTAYEAENGVLSGSSQILTGSGFSGGRVVGWLGVYICSNEKRCVF